MLLFFATKDSSREEAPLPRWHGRRRSVRESFRLRVPAQNALRAQPPPNRHVALWPCSHRGTAVLLLRGGEKNYVEAPHVHRSRWRYWSNASGKGSGTDVAGKRQARRYDSRAVAPALP